jgi:hypothetical protein
MTKAEFLHLNAGTQRWVLLRSLRFVLWSFAHHSVNAKVGESAASVFDDLDQAADYAAQEEVITP